MKIEDIEVGNTYYYLMPATGEYKYHPGVYVEVLSVKEKRILVRFKMPTLETVVTRHIDPGNLVEIDEEVIDQEVSV
jgi:hypothetical protein